VGGGGLSENRKRGLHGTKGNNVSGPKLGVRKEKELVATRWAGENSTIKKDSRYRTRRGKGGGKTPGTTRHQSQVEGDMRA